MALPGDKAARAVPTAGEGQVQPAGVDLRVQLVERIMGEGVLDIGSKVIPEGVPVEPVDGWWVLEPGAYRVRFLDAVEVPGDAVGLCFPRSSLLRMGAFLACAVWDPGYRGRGQALLVVYNPRGVRIRMGARIAQIVFFRLEGPPASLYKGSYYGEGL